MSDSSQPNNCIVLLVFLRPWVFYIYTTRCLGCLLSANKNRNSHWQASLFCKYYHVRPFPITEETVCNFAVFLSRSLKLYGSIRNYLSSLKHFQLMNGFQVTWDDSYYLFLTLRGLKRMLGDNTQAKHPVTPEILYCHIQVIRYE